MDFHKKVPAVICLVSVIAISLSACSGFEGKKALPVAKLSSKPTEIKTTKLKKGDIEVSVSGIGFLTPSKVTSLFYKDISGPLKKLLVRQNDIVKPGTPISEIDISDLVKYQENMKMEMNKWRYTSLQDEENLYISNKNLRLAQIDLNEATKKHKSNSTPENKMLLEKAQIKLALAESYKKNAVWNIEIGKIQHNQDVSKFNKEQLKLSNAILKSTIGGIVVEVSDINENEYIKAGQEIAKIVKTLDVVFQFLTSEARYIQGNMDAVLLLDGENFNVKLYNTRPGDLNANNSDDIKSKNTVFLSFKDKRPNKLLNEDAKAILKIKKTGVYLLPAADVRDENNKSYVDVLSKNGINSVEVTKGISSDDYVEIVNGISEEDQIIEN